MLWLSPSVSGSKVFIENCKNHKCNQEGYHRDYQWEEGVLARLLIAFNICIENHKAMHNTVFYTTFF